MSWSFIRREWGAVSFVLTVFLGVVIVPIGLYFGNQSPTTSGSAASAAAISTPTATATASAARTVSPSPTR